MRTEIPWPELEPFVLDLVRVIDEPGLTLDRISNISMSPFTLTVSLVSPIGQGMRTVTYVITHETERGDAAEF